MNPRPCDREAVALLASSALGPVESTRVHQHLEECPACQDCFIHLSALCDSHSSAAKELPEADAVPRVYRRVASAIRASSHPASKPVLETWISRWIRPAGAAGVVLLLVAVGLMIPRQPQPSVRLAVQPIPKSPPPTVSNHPAPRLITYRLALNRSTEELDRLLADDGRHSTGTLPALFRINLAMAEPEP